MHLPPPQQFYAALTLLVMALFVASGYGPMARWRRWLRHGAIAGFALALAAALVEIALWLLGRG